MSVRDVLIVGAGPSGLATAIAAKQAGLDYVVVEKGILVNSIFNFPVHMVFFTTPELLEIGGLPLVTPYDKPTRLEALRYYRRVVDTYGLQISFHEEVVSIEPPSPRASDDAPSATARQGLSPGSSDHVPVAPSREGGSSPGASEGTPPATARYGSDDPEGPREQDVFAVTTRGKRGAQRVRYARAVVLAIGYYDLPNYLGVPGEDLPHVNHYYTDAHPHYRQRVVVVGGKNSAAEAALELFRGGAHVTLVHRHATLGDSIKYWVRPDIENRIKEGSIAVRFESTVAEITPTEVVIERHPSTPTGHPETTPHGTREAIPAEAVFLLTGYHPDAALMTAAGIACDPVTLAPALDPATFETNVPNLFLAGGAVAGRETGSIFIENGRFHGQKIVDVLAGRLRGA